MHERDHHAALRAERDYVERATARFRHITIQDGYRGHGFPEYAFGLASLVDVIAADWAARWPELQEKTLDWAADVHRYEDPAEGFSP